MADGQTYNLKITNSWRASKRKVEREIHESENRERRETGEKQARDGAMANSLT